MRGFGWGGANESSKFGDENRGLASPERESAKASSLTTEYPANGSSFQNHILSTERLNGVPEIRSVEEEGSCRNAELRMTNAELSSKEFNTHYLKFVIHMASAHTFVVKLLRAYGECLGARSR